MPHQRKLSDCEQQKAKELLQVKANKKMIKNKLEKQTGKVITLKDLSNLMAQSKSESSRNNLESAVRQLCEKHGKSVLLYFVCILYDKATHAVT